MTLKQVMNSMRLKRICSLFALLSSFTHLAFSNPPPPPSPREIKSASDDAEEALYLGNDFVAFVQALVVNPVLGSQPLLQSLIPNPMGADNALRRLVRARTGVEEIVSTDQEEAPDQKRHRSDPESRDGEAIDPELETEPIEAPQPVINAPALLLEPEQTLFLGRMPWDNFNHLAPFLTAIDLLTLRTVNRAHRDAVHTYLRSSVFLHVGENDIEDLLSDTQEGSPALEFFSGLGITNFGEDADFEPLATLMRRLPNVRALILSMPHLSEQFMRELSERSLSDPFREIDFIALRNLEREYYAVTHLSIFIRDLPELRHLGLYTASISDGEIAALAHALASLPRLRSFAIETMESEDVRAIRWLSRLFPSRSGIEFLVLGFGNNIGDEGADCIIDLVRKCPNLRLLQVRFGPTVSEARVRALLVALREMPRLRSVFFFEAGGETKEVPAWMTQALPRIFIKFLNECFPIELLHLIQKEYRFSLM